MITTDRIIRRAIPVLFPLAAFGCGAASTSSSYPGSNQETTSSCSFFSEKPTSKAAQKCVDTLKGRIVLVDFRTSPPDTSKLVAAVRTDLGGYVRQND